MKRRIEIGFVGAGNYAPSMLLPHLAKLSAASLAPVATTRSLPAVCATTRATIAVGESLLSGRPEKVSR